jgi:hypothetical protein
MPTSSACTSSGASGEALRVWMLALVAVQAAFVIFVAAVTRNDAGWRVGGALAALGIGLAMPAIASKGFTRTRRRS